MRPSKNLEKKIRLDRYWRDIEGYLRKSIADLSLLRSLLAIHQNSCYPSLWKVKDSFFFSKFDKNILRQLVAYWSLTLDTEDLLDWYKQKEWFL